MLRNEAWGPVEGEPGGQYGSCGTYGTCVTVYVRDERRPDNWQIPGVAVDGTIYRPAFAGGEHKTVAGYGYMRRREPVEDLPAGTLRGHVVAPPSDPVVIASCIIEQAELNRVRRETGAWPTHITHYDPSGSVLYLDELVWGDEPRMAAEAAAVANA
jgi:hypothetical protein